MFYAKFISALSLKCRVAIGKQDAKEGVCPSTQDRCINIITNGVANYRCGSALEMSGYGLSESRTTSHGCITRLGITYCACLKDLCIPEGSGNICIEVTI